MYLVARIAGCSRRPGFRSECILHESVYLPCFQVSFLERARLGADLEYVWEELGVEKCLV